MEAYTVPWSVCSDRFRCPFQQAYDIIQAIRVLLSGATPFRHLTGQYLLCEDIEVEGDLYVHVPDLECRHVRYNHLTWTVNRLPCRVYQIGIPVPDLARLIAYLMPGLGLDAEEPEAFVGIALAYVNMLVDPDICSRPPVAMRAVLFVYCPYKLYHLFTVDVAPGWRSSFPLVITGAAYAHKAAYVPDGIVP